MTSVAIRIDIDKLQKILDNGLAEQWVRNLISDYGFEEHSTCRHCDRPISLGGDGRWVHQDGGVRMCRAAAFEYDPERWDTWPKDDRRSAAPIKGVGAAR